MDYPALMEIALAEAAKSGNDVPVGAIIIDADGNQIANAHNNREVTNDPTGHAELIAIREAAALLKDWRLTGCTLVVTLEPCVMCAGAIVAARIPKVVFGAWDDRVGASGSLYDLLRDSRLGNPVEVIGGVLEDQAAAQLKQFFADKR
ncbi:MULTISPECIES: nucleoside deaminase [Rhodoluna]|jgi:tRNA(adenine34) deaminase|uniref:nucleoside deaminase n=1 Tax=Rhodoluna TaxID=529883 RepID=UPI001FE47EE9|nr:MULTISPECIES: nucleoside deaminase [Rhodoluna]BDS48555.1 tRNA-specific adenosine deaminase [Rhodoluna sp. KAS3]